MTAWFGGKACGSGMRDAVLPVVSATLSLFVLLIAGCQAEHQHSVSNATPQSGVTKTTDVLHPAVTEQDMYGFGYKRGTEDRAHSSHDYRNEFGKDPGMATMYLLYNNSVDGKDDPTGIALAKRYGDVRDQSAQHKLIAAFIRGYSEGYGAPRGRGNKS